MAIFNVAEKFTSINGEGRKAGQTAVFIRLKGCNLNCSYCDTKWANTNDCISTEMTEEDIYRYIKSTGINNVTLTGGEPLLHKDVSVLLDKLSTDTTLNVEIETNGSIDISVADNVSGKRPSVTLDYKTPTSNMEKFMLADNYKLIKKEDTVKFVCGSKNDLEKALYVITKYQLTEKCAVYLSPVFGSIEPSAIVDFMIRNKLNNVNLQIQMHKIIWDPQKRGV